MDLLLQIALFLLLGIVLHAVDGAFGTALYRAWYNMTHKSPLATGERRGFLQQQSLLVRLYWALGITGLAAVAVLLSGTFFQDTTRILLNLLALLVGLSAGFLFAPGILVAFPSKWNKASKYLEETERGAGSGSVGSARHPDAGSAASGTGSAAAPSPAAPSTAQPAAATAQTPSPESPASDTRTDSRTATPEKPDWRKGVDDFLNKP